MSDFSYWVICKIGRPIIWITSRQTVLHADRAALPGPFILASSHLSPYDVAALMAVTRRHLDFLSITEMLEKPFVGPFFRAMNCTFLDRSKTDPNAAHSLAGRLKSGRAIAMFPEGGIKTEETSVINGGPFKPGVIRLAHLCNVPIIPAVVLGTIGYKRSTAWIPNRSVPFGVNYGKPIRVEANDDVEQAKKMATEQLAKAFVDLAAELRAAMIRR